MSALFEDLCDRGYSLVADERAAPGRLAALLAARWLFALPPAVRCAFHQGEWGGLVGYQFGDPNELRLGEEPVSAYWHLVSPRPGGFANRWPPGADRPALEAYLRAREVLALEALGRIEEGLGSGETLRGWVRQGYAMLRLIHYPACAVAQRATAGGLRASEHVDAGLLSVYDGGDQPGLELRDPDGRWIPVAPGARVIAAGELLSRFSEGRIPGALHRVRYPEGDAAARIAMPFFLNPRFDQDIGGSSYGEFLRSRTGWGAVSG